MICIEHTCNMRRWKKWFSLKQSYLQLCSHLQRNNLFKRCQSNTWTRVQQVHYTPAKTTAGTLCNIPVMSALVNYPLQVFIQLCTRMTVGSIKQCRRVCTQNQQRTYGQWVCGWVCVFTSDCNVPSSTIISLIDWSLVWDIVLRHQSKKSPRRFCFTSGRVMNLQSHVQYNKTEIKGFI